MPAPSTPRIDWPAVHRVAGAFRLAIPRTPIGGRLGERLGAGTGSSLEFQDYRQYAAGDDLRHVDWAAYARSEMLTVRLYREEVAPRIDLALDVSRSMTVSEQKASGYRDLAGLLACACGSTEADARILTTSAIEPRPFGRPEEIERFLLCDAAASILEEGHVSFRRRSLRVVMSDFLFPHDPDVLIGRLARDGSSLAIIQFTLKEEAEPVVEGGLRLLDVEGRGELDIVVDEKAVQEYRERFSRLRQGLARAVRRAGGGFAHIVAGTPLRDAARALVSAGVLESAS
jgi:uncharacterized protein (DUF58 family)